MSDFQFDMSEFKAGINAVLVATDKAMPDVLNRAALTAIIGGKGVKGAIQRTPRADRGKIAAVPVAEIAARVAKRLRGKGKKVDKVEFARLVGLERRRMRSSIAYTAGPGWDKAARAFGGRGVKRQAGFEKSEAAKGYGSRARVGNLLAIIANTAPAAVKIGAKPLQDALNDTGRDLQEYAAKKVQEIFTKHSAK